MRIATALFAFACLIATAHVVYAQESYLDVTDSRLSNDNLVGSSVLKSATEAASRLGMQPNATPQRARRRGRLATGIGLLGGAGALLAVGYLLDNKTEVSDAITLPIAVGIYGLIGSGIALIALADSTSPISVPVDVVPTPGGAAAFKSYTF